MREWIWNNKEWLFSGLGVLLVTAIWTALKKQLTQKQKAPSIANSAFEFSSITPVIPESKPAEIWHIVERLPLPGCRTWAWRHIYTPARITANVRLSISGGEHGMRFYRAEEASTASISLHVVNFTPFPITVDRIIGDIGVANTPIAPFNHMRRAKMAKFSDEILYFEIPLSEQQIRRVHQLYKQNPLGSVSTTIYLSTAFGEIEILKYLKTRNAEFVNFHQLESQT